MTVKNWSGVGIANPVLHFLISRSAENNKSIILVELGAAHGQASFQQLMKLQLLAQQKNQIIFISLFLYAIYVLYTTVVFLYLGKK